MSTLDAYRPVKGLRVAVQEYGLPNPDLLKALTQRGATVVSVPVYRWALPEDTAPLTQVLGEILAGHVQVMLVTNAAQIDHVMQVLEQEGLSTQFRESCKKLVVASIGPTASERIRSHGLPMDLEPSHGKMGVLVKETSEQTLHSWQQNNKSASCRVAHRTPPQTDTQTTAIVRYLGSADSTSAPSFMSRAQRNPSQFIFVVGSVPLR